MSCMLVRSSLAYSDDYISLIKTQSFCWCVCKHSIDFNRTFKINTTLEMLRYIHVVLMFIIGRIGLFLPG